MAGKSALWKMNYETEIMNVIMKYVSGKLNWVMKFKLWNYKLKTKFSNYGLWKWFMKWRLWKLKYRIINYEMEIILSDSNDAQRYEIGWGP